MLKNKVYFYHLCKLPVNLNITEGKLWDVDHVQNLKLEAKNR